MYIYTSKRKSQYNSKVILSQLYGLSSRTLYLRKEYSSLPYDHQASVSSQLCIFWTIDQDPGGWKSRETRKNLLPREEHWGWQEQKTWSLWSPPTILMLKMCSLSSSCSSLSVLVVAGRPDLMFTSLKHPTAKSPCKMHLLTNGLYLSGWSNRLTKDQTYTISTASSTVTSFAGSKRKFRENIWRAKASNHFLITKETKSESFFTIKRLLNQQNARSDHPYLYTCWFAVSARQPLPSKIPNYKILQIALKQKLTLWNYSYFRIS